ncbi:hypothetical protein Sjap_003596 [Stephania japonica]|uniref:Uncharacterized protein n=1 Tax=Stephania japonica TaxID=461633 RepID=A0AAP0PXB2_9MAGN
MRRCEVRWNEVERGAGEEVERGEVERGAEELFDDLRRDEIEISCEVNVRDTTVSLGDRERNYEMVPTELNKAIMQARTELLQRRKVANSNSKVYLDCFIAMLDLLRVSPKLETLVLQNELGGAVGRTAALGRLSGTKNEELSLVGFDHTRLWEPTETSFMSWWELVETKIFSKVKRSRQTPTETIEDVKMWAD